MPRPARVRAQRPGEMPGEMPCEMRSALREVANPAASPAAQSSAAESSLINYRGNIMSLIKWQPFGDFDDAFNRLMPALFSRSGRVATENGGKFAWAPSADISETDQEYLIRAELPAVKKEDVKVTLDQGMITIHGERKEEKETRDEKFHRVESFRGAFSRSFSVPDNIDEKAIRADAKDGVLTVHLPKARSAMPKTVEVKVQ
jgi:HSP20 family protein